MVKSNGKTVLLCGVILIGVTTSAFALEKMVYKTAGTYEYTAPAFGTIHSIQVTMVGGGGGGSGGDPGFGTGTDSGSMYANMLEPNLSSGGGGGSGAVKTCNFYPPSMDNQVLAIKINVGAGGKGGMGGATGNPGGKKGENGGDTSITTTDTATASRNPIYGSQSGMMAAGGSGGTGTSFEFSKRSEIRTGGAGGGLSVACRFPDANPISEAPGLSGDTGTWRTPGAGAAGSLLEACTGAGAGGKGGLMGLMSNPHDIIKGLPADPGLPGESGTDGCVILELVPW